MKALEVTVSKVSRTVEMSGSVFCPRCGWRLGEASSPALCYQSRCSNCGRAIAIAIENAKVRIVVEDELREH